MVYKTNERVFIVNIFLKTKSHKAVRQEFLKEFKREGPRDKYIRELVKKFKETGSVANKKHNRKRTVLTEEKLKEAKESFLRSPKKSLSRRSAQLKISKTASHTASDLLNFRPYRVIQVQELKGPDYGKRKEFCEWFFNFIETDGILG
jgi:hypothetical protein